MDERVKECLDTIGEAFKKLIVSANNEAEVIGLMSMVLSSWTEIYNEAIDEGIDELEKREEGN